MVHGPGPWGGPWIPVHVLLKIHPEIQHIRGSTFIRRISHQMILFIKDENHGVLEAKNRASMTERREGKKDRVKIHKLAKKEQG